MKEIFRCQVGGQYTFTGGDSTIRSPTVTDDPNHSYRVDLNTYEGRIQIIQGGTPATICADIQLTTDPAVNLPPIVRSPSYVTSSPSCTSVNSTYDITPNFFGHDKDGFIINEIVAKFALDGGDLVTLTNQGDGTSCDTVTAAKSWDPAAPTNGGWYCTASNDVLNQIPCTSGYNWEVSATDNEDLTTTITGGGSAPLSGVTPTAGTRLLCNENYLTAACDGLISLATVGSSTTSHPNGSCVTLVPPPSTTITTSELTTANPDIFLGNVIVNYDNAGSGLPAVSCLVTLDQ